MPLGLVVSGANTPDGKLLEKTLLAMPVRRPAAEAGEPHLSLDKGCRGEPCATLAANLGYVLHVPEKANAKKTEAQTWTA